MKEATGELNMTVITVVAIAAIAGLFYAFVWPMIQRSIVQNTTELLTINSTYTYNGMPIVNIDESAIYILLDKENFIVTTACVAGVGNDEDIVKFLYDKFGENLFLMNSSQF